MLHFLGMKELFGGLPSEDPNKYLKDFSKVCLAYNISYIYLEGIRLRIFTISLIDETTTWLGVSPEESITV